MSQERTDQASLLSEDGAVAKRTWHSPEIQEVDVFETEASMTVYAPDAGTYGS
jgi:hypothetical protein